MRDYREDEIEAYVASGDPLDKAGAYAIQHTGFHPVESLGGCYASVMGLPLCHLTRSLRSLGVATHYRHRGRVPISIGICLSHFFRRPARGNGWLIRKEISNEIHPIE